MIFVYRDEYYLTRREPDRDSDAHAKWETKMALARGKAELVVAKSRNGPCATATVGFDGAFMRFYDLVAR